MSASAATGIIETWRNTMKRSMNTCKPNKSFLMQNNPTRRAESANTPGAFNLFSRAL